MSLAKNVFFALSELPYKYRWGHIAKDSFKFSTALWIFLLTQNLSYWRGMLKSPVSTIMVSFNFPLSFRCLFHTFTGSVMATYLFTFVRCFEINCSFVIFYALLFLKCFLLIYCMCFMINTWKSCRFPWFYF